MNAEPIMATVIWVSNSPLAHDVRPRYNWAGEIVNLCEGKISTRFTPFMTTSERMSINGGNAFGLLSYEPDRRYLNGFKENEFIGLQSLQDGLHIQAPRFAFSSKIEPKANHDGLLEVREIPRVQNGEKRH